MSHLADDPREWSDPLHVDDAAESTWHASVESSVKGRGTRDIGSVLLFASMVEAVANAQSPLFNRVADSLVGEGSIYVAGIRRAATIEQAAGAHAT